MFRKPSRFLCFLGLLTSTNLASYFESSRCQTLNDSTYHCTRTTRRGNKSIPYWLLHLAILFYSNVKNAIIFRMPFSK